MSGLISQDELMHLYDPSMYIQVIKAKYANSINLTYRPNVPKTSIDTIQSVDTDLYYYKDKRVKSVGIALTNTPPGTLSKEDKLISVNTMGVNLYEYFGVDRELNAGEVLTRLNNGI